MTREFLTTKKCKQINEISWTWLNEELVIADLRSKIVAENGDVLVSENQKSLVLDYKSFSDLQAGSVNVKNYVPGNLKRSLLPLLLRERGKERLLSEGNFIINSNLYESLTMDKDLYAFSNKGNAAKFVEDQGLDENALIYCDMRDYSLFDANGYPLRRGIRFRDISSDSYEIEKVVEILQARDDIEFIKARASDKSVISFVPNYDDNDTYREVVDFMWTPSRESWDVLVKNLEANGNPRIEGTTALSLILNEFDMLGIASTKIVEDQVSPTL